MADYERFLKELAKKRKETGSKAALAKEAGVTEQSVQNAFYRKSFGTGFYDAIVKRWPEMTPLLARETLRHSRLMTDHKVKKPSKPKREKPKALLALPAPAEPLEAKVDITWVLTLGHLVRQKNGSRWLGCLEHAAQFGMSLEDLVSQLSSVPLND
jgi:hypothetical protein